MVSSYFGNTSLLLEDILVLWTTGMFLKNFATVYEIKSPKWQMTEILFLLCIHNISQHLAYWKKHFIYLFKSWKCICKITMKPVICLSLNAPKEQENAGGVLFGSIKIRLPSSNHSEYQLCTWYVWSGQKWSQFCLILENLSYGKHWLSANLQWLLCIQMF